LQGALTNDVIELRHIERIFGSFVDLQQAEKTRLWSAVGLPTAASNRFTTAVTRR
jgi:hypothetical protein